MSLYTFSYTRRVEKMPLSRQNVLGIIYPTHCRSVASLSTHGHVSPAQPVFSVPQRAGWATRMFAGAFAVPTHFLHREGRDESSD